MLHVSYQVEGKSEDEFTLFDIPHYPIYSKQGVPVQEDLLLITFTRPLIIPSSRARIADAHFVRRYAALMYVL